MRCIHRQTVLVLVTLALLFGTAADAAPNGTQGNSSTAKAGQPAKPRVFLVPARAKVHDQKTMVEGNDVTLWVKAGGVVTAKVNAGLFFVEAGGKLEVDGNVLRIVVAQGGTLVRVDGNVVHLHRAKGAEIGAIGANRDHVTVHDAVSLRQANPFPLNGTVRGLDGRPAAGVKVHAYTLGEQFLASANSDGDGRFTFTTDEEVSTLAAELTPAWADKRIGRSRELELRRRLGLLQGWETAIAHGPWTEKAVVDLSGRPGKLMFKDTRVLASDRGGYPGLKFSADGGLLAVLWPDGVGIGKKGAPEAQLWDVASGERVGRFPLKNDFVPSSELAAFSPDGKLLALVGPNGVHVYRLPAGDELAKLPGQAGDYHCVAFSPDGNLLAAGGKDALRIWNRGKGIVHRTINGHEGGTTCVAFSPDGQTLVSGGAMILKDAHFTIHTADKLRLWDLGFAGKPGQFPREVTELSQPPGQPGQLTFTPDGLLLSAGQAERLFRFEGGLSSRVEAVVVLANPSTGREFLRLSDRGPRAAVSADSRLVVTAGDGMIRFWEVLSGEEVLAVPIPEHWTPALGLAPGGKLLATSREDGSILVWDLHWDRLRVPQKPALFTDAAREQLWQDLAGNAAGAYDVVWQLSKAPDAAVQFLEQRLRPIPAQVLPIKKWLEELGNSEFAVREAASRELRVHGRVVESSLRQALMAKPPLEVRRRIEGLLEEVRRRPYTVDELRQARAIAALEWIGTSRARALLTELSAGWAEALQTQEAAAALRRLSR